MASSTGSFVVRESWRLLELLNRAAAQPPLSVDLILVVSIDWGLSCLLAGGALNFDVSLESYPKSLFRCTRGCAAMMEKHTVMWISKSLETYCQRVN